MIAFDYEKFQLKGCEWENFGVSDKWSFMGAGRLRNVVAHTGWTVLIVFVDQFNEIRWF